MLCKACGKEIDANKKFCKHCGTPIKQSEDIGHLANQTLRCAQCGATLKAGTTFCTQCGTHVSKNANPNINVPEKGKSLKKVEIRLENYYCNYYYYCDTVDWLYRILFC